MSILIAMPSDEVLPQLEMLIDDETEVEAEAEAKGENADEMVKILVVSIPDGDVTPLVLSETGEEIVVPVDALGEPGPEVDVDGDGNRYLRASSGSGALCDSCTLHLRSVVVVVSILTRVSWILHPPS